MRNMKKLTVLTVLTLVAMVLMAGAVVASPQMTGAGWNSSNRSGEVIATDGIIRNAANQLTHTDFQVNTNSCASCHMTHTALGSNLLIRANTNDTCIACHNGTMGFLNVNALPSGTSATTGMGGSIAAGTFGIQASGRTPSWHNTTGAVNISGAPGGNRSGASERGAWSSSFTCASCHAPHGSHSIRLLHFNPNNVAVRAEVNTAVYGVEGGRYRVSTATNINLGAGNFTTAAHAVFGTVYTYTLTGLADTAPWVAGYTYSHTIGGGVGRTNQFWTRVYHTAWDPNASGFADPTTDVTATNANNLLTRHFTINFATGTVMQTDAQRAALIARLQAAPFSLGAGAETAALRIDVARGLQVRARAAEAYQGNLVAGARQVDFINPATYDAPAYNLFCAACHTDYLPTISAGSQTGTGVGIYSQRFRHSINRGASTGPSPMPVRGATTFVGANLVGNVGTSTNRLMCVSCHFAHGADASMMLLANNTRISGNTGAAGSATDPNQNDVSGALGAGGSSALKRYVNQASCWHCHVRSSATPFLNTSYFWSQMPVGPTW